MGSVGDFVVIYVIYRVCFFVALSWRFCGNLCDLEFFLIWLLYYVI